MDISQAVYSSQLIDGLVSIIVPTRNSAGTLSDCLSSIRAQTYPSIEVIVVDNYSSDDTRRIATAFNAIVLLCSGERSRQVNAGVRLSRGEFVYRTDGDFVLQENVVAECVNGCRANHVDGALIHNSSDPTVSLWAQVRNMERDMYKDDDLNVAVRFLTRSSYDALGGFDESLVAGEDYDLHNRFLNRGFRYVRVDSVEVHKGEPKSISETVLKHYYYGKTLGRFVRKNKYRAFRQLSPFRPAFVRHRNLFAGHLRLTIAFNFYTLVRYFSAFAGLLVGKTEALPEILPTPTPWAGELPSQFSPTMALTAITTIIPTKNSAKTIRKCIESIQNFGHQDSVRIIIVDNHSTDQTCEIARMLGATVVDGGPERSAQRNIGALNAASEYLLFVDSDMEFTPSVLDDCTKAVNAGVDAAVISEITVGNGFWASVRKLERASYFGDSLYEAARLFRKTSFFRLGGYDLSLTGLEDYDIQARIEGAKLKIAHLKSPILHHEEAFNVKNHLMKKYYYASRSRIYLSKYPRRSIAQFFPLRRTYLKKESPVVHNPSKFAGIMFLKVAEVVVASLGVILNHGNRN